MTCLRAYRRSRSLGQQNVAAFLEKCVEAGQLDDTAAILFVEHAEERGP